MTTIKLAALASIFVFTSGTVFSETFKKNKRLSILAAVVAITSSYYLFASIYKDIVKEVAERSVSVTTPSPAESSGTTSSDTESSDAEPPNEAPQSAEPQSSQPQSSQPGSNGSQTNESTVQHKAPPPPPLVTADAPPSDRYIMSSIGGQPDTQLRISKVSERANEITDNDNWWIGNGLKRPTYKVPNPFFKSQGNVPAEVPTRFENSMLVKVIRGDPILAIYGGNFSEGRYLLAIDAASGEILFSFDFILYKWPPSFEQNKKAYVDMALNWAHVEESTLYVSHRHRTYAKYSKGKNAYITAIDIPSNTILWRTAPLVSNSTNFIVKGDAILTGYGFTAERDYLFVLNKSDGEIVQKVPVKTGPDDLVEKDDRLFVRTYNTDYIFAYTR